MLTQGSALLLKTAQQSFWNSYYSISDPFDGLVWRKTSSQLTDTYPRLGAAPMPEEWVGPKSVKVANEYKLDVTNKAFASGVRIGKELIKFQQWDEVARLVGNLGQKARAHQIKLLSTLLVNGEAALCEDGQYFFDTDHADSGAEYSTAQDNDLTANIADPLAPTDLEFATAVRAMTDQLFTFKDDRGDPMIPPTDGPTDFVLMIPPKYRSIANRVLRADALTGAIGNDLKATYTPRINPFLTAPTASAGYMFLLYSGSNHKPLGLQVVQDVNLMDNLQGDEYQQTGNAVFTADWWGREFYGQWRTAVQYKFT